MNPQDTLNEAQGRLNAAQGTLNAKQGKLNASTQSSIRYLSFGLIMLALALVANIATDFL